MLPFLLRPLLFLLLADVGASGEILWSYSANSGLSRGILVPVDDFGGKQLIGMARQALRSQTTPFLHLAALTSHRQRTSFVNISDLSFDFWRQRCDSAVNTPTQVAELISIGTDAVLRIRDAMNIRYIQLEGSNPLEYKNDDSDFRIVFITMTSDPLFRFVVYAKAKSGFNVKAAEEFVGDLRSKLHDDSVYLVLRRDPWFFVDGRVAPCWWAAGLAVPAANVIDHAPEIRCPQPGPDGLRCIAYRVK